MVTASAWSSTSTMGRPSADRRGQPGHFHDARTRDAKDRNTLGWRRSTRSSAAAM